jgi:hypothetical protein
MQQPNDPSSHRVSSEPDETSRHPELRCLFPIPSMGLLKRGPVTTSSHPLSQNHNVPHSSSLSVPNSLLQSSEDVGGHLNRGDLGTSQRMGVDVNAVIHPLMDRVCAPLCSHTWSNFFYSPMTSRCSLLLDIQLHRRARIFHFFRSRPSSLSRIPLPQAYTRLHPTPWMLDFLRPH